MNIPSELLIFLLDHKISIPEAIKMLEEADKKIKSKFKEKAVIKDYEKR